MKNEQNTGPSPTAQNHKTDGQPGATTERQANSPLEISVPAPVRPGPVLSNPEPLVYDIKQAAAALNICTKTVRRLLARGKLTSCKVLRKVLIPREQIAAFLKATCDKPNFQ
jgi:excisionase family DNA binding protein